MKINKNKSSIRKRGTKRKLFASTILIIRLFFCVPQSASASANSKNGLNEVSYKAPISRTLDEANLNQNDLTHSSFHRNDSKN